MIQAKPGVSIELMDLVKAVEPGLLERRCYLTKPPIAGTSQNRFPNPFIEIKQTVSETSIDFLIHFVILFMYSKIASLCTKNIFLK